MAEFKVNSLFKIHNRGHVLGGDIIGGEISGGDLINVLKEDGDTIGIKIKSVEFIDRTSRQEVAIGLMLGILEENVKVLVENLVDQTILITNDY